MKRLGYGFLLLAVLALSLPASELGEEERAAALRERPFVFGVAVDWNPTCFSVSPERYREDLGERIQALGATVTRVPFDWARIEKSPGEYEFEETDEDVRRALGLGLEVVGRIVGSAGWANARGKDGLYPPRASMTSDFSLFCERLAARYRNRVNLFEFWVEPDGAGWPPEPNASEYIRWLWTCRDAVRRGNPRAMVAVGALGPRGSAFLGEMLDLNAVLEFDAVAVDGRSSAEGAGAGAALDSRRILEIRNLCQMPIWVTSYGWPVEEVGIKRQAELVTEALDWIAARPWIEVAICERMADPPGARSDLFGLCDENLLPRPAYRSFARYVIAPGGIEQEPEPPRFARPEGDQLALNPGFEQTGEGGDPKGWSRWGASPDRKRTPEDSVFLRLPHGGEKAFYSLTEGEAIQGGLRQTLTVPESSWIAASVWTYVTSTHIPPKARIGIDLSGGTSPSDEMTTWSDWYTTNQEDEGWVEIGLKYPVRVEGERATVFLEWSQPVAAGSSVVGFDDVRVSAVEP